MGNDVNNDGDSVMGDDVDNYGDGVAGCDDEDDGDGRRRATMSMMIALARRTMTSTTMVMAIMCHAIPVHIWGSLIPPYAYGDRSRSPYAYGDSMTHNPYMHKGISYIPVCIRGLILIPVDWF